MSLTDKELTIAGNIRRIEWLLAQTGGVGDDPRLVTLYAKFGAELDPLRRLVTCQMHLGSMLAPCHGCFGFPGGHPYSRDDYWTRLEARDPGTLYQPLEDAAFLAQPGGLSSPSPLLIAVVETSEFLHGTEKTLAALQAVVAVLEATS